MVFSSILFLFRFMPIVFGVYYICPKKYKNLWLFAASVFFYAWGEFGYLPIILFACYKDYVLGLAIEQARGTVWKMKLFLTLSVVINIGYLLFFKYSNFFIANVNTLFSTSIGLLSISLPVGISFFTFQTQSYTIDVYRGVVKAEKSFINYGTYVTLFPQLVAGPIVTYSDVQKELNDRTITLGEIQSGVFTFIMGLGSKVLVANNLGTAWNELEDIAFNGISSPLAWLGLVFYGLQIYFDFNGYSLMAIGLGKMLGFKFPKNFDYPYGSVSVTEFWRRWHMTLGSWFRQYIYIPLGGNRKGNARQYFNLFVVWALTGFWHGANWNFVAWGLFFFVFICIEKIFLLKKLEQYRWLGHIYLVFVVLVSWSLFAISDTSLLKGYLANLFSFTGGIDWVYYLRNYGVLLVFGVFFALPIAPRLNAKITKYRTILGSVFAGIILIFSVAYLVDSSYNPFLYFRF